ncbi:MAG: hypothetical protein M3O64_05755 [Chloroflexota bacterium]|nr:hypothetical protein [Chloroflexota bacterium]
MTGPEYTLFHRIAEATSARVRSRIVELGLKPRIDFQNAETDGAAELALLGGGPTPALWDGRVLTVGEAAVLAVVAGIHPGGGSAGATAA